MKTKPIPILLGIALPILAFASMGNSQQGQGAPSGSVEYLPGSNNTNPVLSPVTNPSGGLDANDLHLKLVPATPALDLKTQTPKKGTRLLGPNGVILKGWTIKKRGGGEYDFEMDPNGDPIPKNSNTTSLELLSKSNTKGWNRAIVSLTWNGKVIVPPKTLADTPGIIKTGNRFPVTLGWVTTIENGGAFAITQIQLSVDTNQSFVEIGSDRPGFGIPTDGVYVFEEPILPGESADLWWVYDAFASNPDQDTEVTITPITEAQVLMVQSPTSTQTTSKQSRTRKPAQLPSWKASTGNVLLPKMKIVVLDPKLKRAVLLNRGKFQFEAKGAVLRLLKGKAKIGKPFVGTSGALVIPYEGGKTPFTLELSGVVAKFGTNTKKGIVRVFLKGKHSEMRVPVGFRR